MSRINQVLAPLLLLVWLPAGGCNRMDAEPDQLNLSGLTMGTIYNIKITAPPPAVTRQQLVTGIDGILTAINSSMSTYLAESELSQLNHSGSNDWLEISADLYQVLTMALDVSRLTQGAFDITVGPVVDLWGFGSRDGPEELPSPDRIRATLKSVGFQHLQLQQSPAALKKTRAGITIDLSGVAKGYAVDRLADYLTSLAIENYLVEIGGEIRARGVNARGLSWQIGIEKPLTDLRSVQRVISLNNTGMATSGDYRNYFIQDGIRYSHTINPRTGRPVNHSLASVTVLHASAAVADALATGLLVLGPAAGPELARHENIAALFLLATATGYEELYTPAFSAYIPEHE